MLMVEPLSITVVNPHLIPLGELDTKERETFERMIALSMKHVDKLIVQDSQQSGFTVGPIYLAIGRDDENHLVGFWTAKGPDYWPVTPTGRSIHFNDDATVEGVKAALEMDAFGWIESFDRVGKKSDDQIMREFHGH